MNRSPYPISVALLFLCFVNAHTAADIHINCGSIGTSMATNGREWVGDATTPKSNPSVLVQRGSSASVQTASADPVPHRTARISRTRFSYKFRLKPAGQKILRLHFNSAPYKGFKGLIDLFTVEAGPFILLGNFSASLTALALSVNSFSKEFCIFLQETQHFTLSFSPESSSTDTYAFVNGIEILSVPDTFAIPNPVPPPQGSKSMTSRISNSVRGDGIIFTFFAVTIISLVCVIVHKLRELWAAKNPKEKHKTSARAERLCRRFSLSEIQLATRNFSDEIGRGGFGKVYRGIIDRGQTTVAVKRLNKNSMQGHNEFLMEIETLSELRHANLVSLIGYCYESREMILVYDYMAGGTLADHLHKLPRENNNFSLLKWKQRLDICIGAGRGLDYLHTGHGVIHRDVKTSNILLNDNYVAKVSDFGLAKHEDKTKLQSHVSTRVKGTKGYLDPHYMHTRKLTRKTDTYAFGVVLFEVLCGRAVVDLSFPEDEHILTIWAREMVNKGKIDTIVASVLRAEISRASLKTYVGVAERCLRDEPKNRPTMSQVVQQLELALVQQDRREVIVPNEITSSTSVGTKQLIVASTNVQNPKEQTNFKRKRVIGEISSWGKATIRNKPFRFWQCGDFWSRFKPHKKKALPLTAVEGLRHLEISLRELKVATENFSNKNILGRGGFGKVYKGQLADGSLVAVKRLREERTQGGELQFQAEVKMISMALHRNLLRLRGFCMTPTERLLVYPYMANGSVASCLRERPESQAPLDWPKRKKIALGSARGLAYLHDHCDTKIIHRDVKAANILLDENFEAVVGDFGLAKLMDHNDTHVSTTFVRGTIGHIAPEYLCTGKPSEKTDVFGYGIFLLELITGARAFDLAQLANDDDEMLIYWLKGLLKEKKLEKIVDADLAGDIDEEVEQHIQVALLCMRGSPTQRPKMSEVEWMLEGNGLVERWEEWQREEIFSQRVHSEFQQ